MLLLSAWTHHFTPYVSQHRYKELFSRLQFSKLQPHFPFLELVHLIFYTLHKYPTKTLSAFSLSFNLMTITHVLIILVLLTHFLLLRPSHIANFLYSCSTYTNASICHICLQLRNKHGVSISPVTFTKFFSIPNK